MDVKQAIGLLQHHINTWKGKFPSRHFEACEFAIKILEKQIPEKVVKRYNPEILEDRIYCSDCSARVFEGEGYCAECGQRLKWE